MKPNDRVKSVYKNRIPDMVPLILDLSHWYKKNYNIHFDLSGFKDVEWNLVNLHKKIGAVAYCEMGRFFNLRITDPSIVEEAFTDKSGVYHHIIKSPWGNLHEQRVFEKTSYSYNIRKHLLESPDDFETVIRLMESVECEPAFELYSRWEEALGELAYIYAQLPYSGLGYLISRNMGVEKTCFAISDRPQITLELVRAVNKCNLKILDTIIDGPFETLVISDNLDGNVQSPALFNRYSRDYYTEVARRLHSKGKYLAVHVDGEMSGCLEILNECGVDCVDAATPAPMFRLTPGQARAAAGEMILSGGIPANVFGACGTDEQFVDSVRNWLDTRLISHRLIIAAGDQVPPDAPLHRIEMLPKLVEKYGQY